MILLFVEIGDPQEMNSITQVFCSKRNGPLLVGSVKSNMGHVEPASGVAALSKLLVAIQDGHIPRKFIHTLSFHFFTFTIYFYS